MAEEGRPLGWNKAEADARQGTFCASDDKWRRRAVDRLERPFQTEPAGPGENSVGTEESRSLCITRILPRSH